MSLERLVSFFFSPPGYKLARMAGLRIKPKSARCLNSSLTTGYISRLLNLKAIMKCYRSGKVDAKNLAMSKERFHQNVLQALVIYRQLSSPSEE